MTLRVEVVQTGLHTAVQTFLRMSFNGRTSASQAENAGSIPVIRSNPSNLSNQWKPSHQGWRPFALSARMSVV
jgi:hypothetical protein